MTWWKNSDMKQCNWFLCSWHITELVPCTDLLRMKPLDTTCYKTVSWFCSNDGSVHFTRLRVHSFTRQHHILKNTWSIKNPDNLVCGWDPLDWSKSDPSDQYRPGHPTHFQPWVKWWNSSLQTGRWSVWRLFLLHILVDVNCLWVFSCIW